MPRTIIGENIKRLRERKGWIQSELAARSGLHPNTIAKIEAGMTKPSLTTANKIATVLNTTVESLTGEGIKYEKQGFRELPLIGTIPAGYPDIREQQSIGDVLVLERDLDTVSDKDNLYCLTVAGESLSGDGIHSGDNVVVDPQGTFINGKIYIVRLGNEVVARHVQKTDSTVKLSATNNGRSNKTAIISSHHFIPVTPYSLENTDIASPPSFSANRSATEQGSAPDPGMVNLTDTLTL